MDTNWVTPIGEETDGPLLGSGVGEEDVDPRPGC